MTTLVESDTALEKARTKHHEIVQRRKDVHGKMEALQQAVSGAEERLIALRADEIVHNRTGGERFEAASAQLATQRDELRALEAEAKALELAERQTAQALHTAEAQANRQAAHRLSSEIQQTVRKLDGMLAQAEKLNDRLIELNAEAKAEGLTELGGKLFLLLTRTGCAWPALDANHKGYVTTLRGWRESVVALLNQDEE